MPSDRTSQEDFEQLGAAFSRVYLMALNGVVCDPTDPCKLCAPFWRQGKAVLDRYDPNWGNMGKPFTPSAAATARPDWESDRKLIAETIRKALGIYPPVNANAINEWYLADELLAAFKRASLGEGEGGR